MKTLMNLQIERILNAKLHTAVRKVLQHHKLTTVGDAVVEADLIHAVLCKEFLGELIEGMSVSVDVSTSEETAGHRYFGTVTEVMEDSSDKNGMTLLVQDPEPNFSI